MIVYGASLSPFVRKVLAFASEKGIEVEHKVLPPNSDDPGFLEASPFRKIPAFRDGDFAISDSSAIISYLDSIRPEPVLIPAEPRERARTIWYDEFADTIFAACGAKMFFNRIVAPLLGREADLSIADKAECEELPPLLDYVEKVLPENGWLVGDGLTLADISVASPLVNLQHLGID
ncbi:MAG: glutathione S-transferase family protein, partial [Allosphingosinicella sp.]